MTTQADIVARVADMLSRTDLNVQIGQEIQIAIRRYNRRASWLTEVRDATFQTVIGQEWYPTIDLSTGAGPQSVTGRTSVSVADIVKVDYLRDADSEPLQQVSKRMFEEFFDTAGSSGSPNYFVLYAGQLGLWPVPNEVQTMTLSAQVKPLVPTLSTDTSIWFTQAQDLIENAAAAAIAAKFTRDVESATIFRANENDAWADLVRESNVKMATGRLRVNE